MERLDFQFCLLGQLLRTAKRLDIVRICNLYLELSIQIFQCISEYVFKVCGSRLRVDKGRVRKRVGCSVFTAEVKNVSLPSLYLYPRRLVAIFVVV